MGSLIVNCPLNKKHPGAFRFRGEIRQSVSDVGQQSDLTGPLDGGGQVPLMGCAGTGGTAGQNLAALGQVTAELGGVLVIDAGHLVHAERANLLALPGTHSTLFVGHGFSLLRKSQ